MAGAPHQFVDPSWLSLMAGAGTQFNNASSIQVRGSNPLPSTPSAQVQFTPNGRPASPRRTTYGPLRRPLCNPALAPSPPSSPTHIRLDPTARPFTPKQSPSCLKVETNLPQELATPASTTPRTPRIQLSPAEDLVVDDAAFRAARQRSQTRRQSSPCRRPSGIQRQGSSSGRKTTVPPPVSLTPMSRVVSAPGRYAPSPGNNPLSPSAPHNTVQALGNPFLAPIQPMNPAAWLTQTHNVGFEHQLRGPQALAGAPRVVQPVAPRSTPARVRASTQGSRPLMCTYPNCHHRAQGKTFKTAGELRKHERTHLPESDRPHGCKVRGCPRRFFWPKDVNRHIEVYHEKLRVRCPHCGAELCRADDLDRHIATVHSTYPTSPRNWAAPSPSASSVASFAMTPQSERSSAMPSTPPTGSSFASGSRPRMQHLTSFDSIPEDGDDAAWSVPMMKSLTR